MKKPLMIVPFALAAVLWLLTFGYAWSEDVSSQGLVGLSILYVGLCVLIIGIFRDQFKLPKPMLNLGIIYTGSILTILASVQLAYISKLFEKWVSIVLMIAVFAMALMYSVILGQKKEYEGTEPSEDSD